MIRARFEVNEDLEDSLPELKRCAERYLWLRQHLGIGSYGPNEWTCWLELACIPYRLDPKTADPQVLLDALIARFPLEQKT